MSKTDLSPGSIGIFQVSVRATEVSAMGVHLGTLDFSKDRMGCSFLVKHLRNGPVVRIGEAIALYSIANAG